MLQETGQLSSEIKGFLKDKGLEGVSLVDNSFNTVLFATHDRYGNIYIRIDNSRDNKALGQLFKPESCGYFDPNRYLKELELSKISNSAGIPVPHILELGQFSDGRAWCIEAEAKGAPLEALWGRLSTKEQVAFLGTLGQAIATIHSVNSQEDANWITSYWDEKISIVFNNLSSLGIYTSGEVENIKATIESLKSSILNHHDGYTATVHLETIFKHVFVTQELEVSGLIDWDTGEIKGDPLADIVFTSFWNSGEGSYTQSGLQLSNPEHFSAVLKGYSRVIQIDQELIYQAVPFYDLMWYLNILWVREAQGQRTKTNRRKKAVANIIDCVYGK